jgi:hypothetical protein
LALYTSYHLSVDILNINMEFINLLMFWQVFFIDFFMLVRSKQGLMLPETCFSLGWFLIWKLFLVRFSFIRELVYGSEESGKRSRETSGSEKSSTPLRRSSRLRARQNKNQHGQL